MTKHDETDDRTVHQGGELEMTGSGVRRRDPDEESSTNHGGELELTGSGMEPVAETDPETEPDDAA